MGTKTSSETQVSPGHQDISELLDQYGCGPVQFAGSGNAFYERHLLFDNVIDLAASTPRDRFEALARSVRDVLEKRNPKRLTTSGWSFSSVPSVAASAPPMDRSL